jgi:tetratricopeptide (TPR) repeat protein
MNTFSVVLIAAGLFVVIGAAVMPILVASRYVLIFMVLLASAVGALVAFLVTRQCDEERHGEEVARINEESEGRIRRLKREHDTTTLEKTIRDGTQTLIKNALDYFKIENIKNEIGSSAAIENLQLDKYGQIIELLADFSLILPDVAENQKIVEDEINHQIQIYAVDENHFARFIERILEKYTVTVNKKIKEKNEMDTLEALKTCPECAERVQPKARICRHCGYQFQRPNQGSFHRAVALQRMANGRKLYDEGNYAEAVRAFDAAIALRSNYALAYYNRAVAQNKLGHRRKAEADLREAAELGHKKAKEILRSHLIPASPDDEPGEEGRDEDAAAAEDSIEADDAEAPDENGGADDAEDRDRQAQA